MLAVSQIRWAVVWPPAPLHSALNHPRFRVTNLDGVQVEREAHVPCERNGSPSCPWFRVVGQLPPSLLLTEHPRWFLWVRVSSVPASLFLFCCFAYVPRNNTFSLAWPLLLGCLWASFQFLCPGTFANAVHLAREVSHQGSASPGELFHPPASGQLLPHPPHHCKHPGTSPLLGAPLPCPPPSFSPHLGLLDSSLLTPCRVSCLAASTAPALENKQTRSQKGLGCS